MVDSDKAGRSGPAGSGGQPELGGDSLEARRKRLATELAAHGARKAPMADDKQKGQGFAEAIKLASEFVAGIVVGAVLGYLLDRFAGTSPWGMIVLLLLGFCAGVLNVLRATGAVAAPKPGERPDFGSARDDDGK